MSESLEECQGALEEGLFQIGDSVVAYTYPLTEGLIVDKQITEEGRLDLTLLIAPHKKKGKQWSRAKISSRDASRLSKKPRKNFLFPIKCAEQLRAEAKRAKADPIWMTAAKEALDKEFQKTMLSSEESEEGQYEEEDEEFHESNSNLFPKELDEDKSIRKGEEFEKRLTEIMQLRSKDNGRKEKVMKKRKDSEEEESDYESYRKWRKERRRIKERKKKQSKVKSVSSTSSSSSSSSSSSEEELEGEKTGGKVSTGMFLCPFHKSDSRGFQDVKFQIQGQAVTRKHIRLILHNLYVAFHTLGSFADKFVAKAYSSPYKPFTMDVSWFQAYAEHLDTLLLNSLGGPWSLWNEPVLDQMVTGFLELMMRVSPYKNFPVCLDDAARKWMKKKRIGANTQFGPVPFAMQHAKFMEGGVVLQQSNVQRNRERQSGGSKQVGTNANRVNNYPVAGTEKRPPPPS